MVITYEDEDYNEKKQNYYYNIYTKNEIYA